MKWRGRRSSRNIDDRRHQRAHFGGGGGRNPLLGILLQLLMRGKFGKGTLVLLAVGGFLLWKSGVNPLELIAGNTGTSVQSREQQAPLNDELSQFVGVVLAETEDVWQNLFQARGKRYPEPTLVLFRDRVKSACGLASSASGPFYCPADSKLYIDLGFYEELRRRFEAPGDFAQAYVIAHEVGHHIQNLTGVLSSFHRQRQKLSETEANALSVRVELQADCYAGIWAHYTARKGLLEKGDLEEALNAAQQIGDDTLQKRAKGYAVPETFNHGTAAQRMRWFQRGYEGGNIDQCNTFEGKV